MSRLWGHCGVLTWVLGFVLSTYLLTLHTALIRFYETLLPFVLWPKVQSLGLWLGLVGCSTAVSPLTEVSVRTLYIY